MERSIFIDRNRIPQDNDLKSALGATFEFWHQVKAFTAGSHKGSIEEWNFPGEKYGWSFRIKDKKRVIVYLFPRDGFFKIAMAYGPRAFETILKSTVSDRIKEELSAAKAYAEGRGIRIEVRDKQILEEIFELIKIKISVSG